MTRRIAIACGIGAAAVVAVRPQHARTAHAASVTMRLGLGALTLLLPSTQSSPRLAAFAAEAVSAQEACTTITADQAVWFGIESVEWKESDGPISFPHCKILSSTANSGAVFSAYQLTDFNKHIPTAAISRIACKPTTRVAHAVLIPGSSQDWTGTLGINAFRLFGGPSADCVAVTTAEHPSQTILERIGEQEAAFTPSNDGWSYVTGLHAITQNTTAMMHSLFFDRMALSDDARLNACVGVSTGVSLGFQLMDDWRGLACDGMLLMVGGDGHTGLFETRRSVCAGTGTIPLTGQVPSFSCAPGALADTVGGFDKDFREEVLRTLDTEGEDAAAALIYRYDLSTRPASVQHLAGQLTPTGNLIRPTIVVQGTHDTLVPANLALQYTERIVSRQRQDLVRFYLANGLNHDPTVNFATAASVRLLTRWMLGNEPHDLVFTAPSIGTMVVTNSKDAGLASDPCGYFDFIVGWPMCATSGLFHR